MPISPADFHHLMQMARTCRRFDEDQPLSMADLDWLVDCARLSPSAKNAQALRFTLVTQGPVLDKLFPLTRWAGALKEGGTPKPGERPTAFIGVLAPSNGGVLVHLDAGITSQTIQLAATVQGWGCCIIYSFDRAAATPLLETPEDMELPLVLALGVAKEARVVAEMPKDGSYNYWRDAQGVHHVPKRSVAELVVRRFSA